ncbi:MAG TPA: hypothetical protein VKA67_13305 [Verrucomicrobiae bacterium]|nr:hypothetical protein [Verrucomicrobiae bacterium]
MKTYSKVTALVGLALALVGTVRAQESVAGKWKAQFDSQIGVQKYTFDFKVDGDKLTGTATGETKMGTNTVTITEGKIATNQITFVEPLKIQDNELRIEYTGKVSGDEIKFHRKVGDFAEEDLVAKRVKDSDAKSDTKTATDSSAAKPNN